MLAFVPSRSCKQLMIILTALLFSSTACDDGQERPETRMDSDTSAVRAEATRPPTKLNCGGQAQPLESRVRKGGQFQVTVIGGSSADVDMRWNDLVHADEKSVHTVQRDSTKTFRIASNAAGEDTLNFAMNGCGNQDLVPPDTARLRNTPKMIVE